MTITLNFKCVTPDETKREITLIFAVKYQTSYSQSHR